MRFTKKIWIVLGVIGSLYLSAPLAMLPPPDLSKAYKSDEPGDTWQIEDVSAYYTDKERKEVVSYYQEYFSKASFLPSLRLNYPPEFGKEVFIDTKQTYYLEELVYPMKQSLFINGYEWENDVFTPVASRKQFILKADGKVWKSKVSLKWFSSSVIVRLAIFWSAWIILLTTANFWIIELAQFIKIFRKTKK